jgi:hypothetical protein
MFGLAAIAAISAMAFLGVSSASATDTVLCTVDTEEPCTNNPYTGHIEGLAVNPELLSNLANVTCGHSIILGNALGLGSGPNGKSQLTHLELIDFTGNCHTTFPEVVSCTVTTIALGLVDLLKTAPNLGLVTSLNNKVRVTCGFLINCTFGGEPTGHALGSTLPLGSTSLGSIVVNEAVLTGEGPLCPEVGKWDAKYTIQLPHALFIAS